MHTLILSLCSLLLGFSICLVLTILTARRIKQQHNAELKTIQSMQLKVNAALKSPPPASDHTASFEHSLKHASLTTELQVPTMLNQHNIVKQAPEKYKILPKLARQGMNTEEIASILEISITEASQLVHLQKLASYNNH